MAISAGTESMCALLSGGGVACWGGNSLGELGIGSTRAVGTAPGQMGIALQLVDFRKGEGRGGLAEAWVTKNKGLLPH